MSPAYLSDMSSTNNNQTLSLPKLRSDSSNLATYSERILNYLTSKGYVAISKVPRINRKHSLSATLAPLSDNDLEKHEDAVDTYDQMQAAVREVIYQTVDKTTFLQVKNEPDAAAIWKKAMSIHADKGSLFEANLLVQLQNARYNEKESMRKHISKMTELRERLAEMNAPIQMNPLYPNSEPHFHSPPRTETSSLRSVLALV